HQSQSSYRCHFLLVQTIEKEEIFPLNVHTIPHLCFCYPDLSFAKQGSLQRGDLLYRENCIRSERLVPASMCHKDQATHPTPHLSRQVRASLDLQPLLV